MLSILPILSCTIREAIMIYVPYLCQVELLRESEMDPHLCWHSRFSWAVSYFHQLGPPPAWSLWLNVIVLSRSSTLYDGCHFPHVSRGRSRFLAFTKLIHAHISEEDPFIFDIYGMDPRDSHVREADPYYLCFVGAFILNVPRGGSLRCLARSVEFLLPSRFWFPSRVAIIARGLIRSSR